MLQPQIRFSRQTFDECVIDKQLASRSDFVNCFRRLGDRQRADCMNQQNQRETSYHRLPFQMVQQDCLIVVKDSFEDILHSTRALFANEPAFAFQNPLSSPRIRFKS